MGVSSSVSALCAPGDVLLMGLCLAGTGDSPWTRVSAQAWGIQQLVRGCAIQLTLASAPLKAQMDLSPKNMSVLFGLLKL